jgi:hypothetical protein
MKIIRATIFLSLLTGLNFAHGQSFDTTLINNKLIFQIRTTNIGKELLLLTATLGNQTIIIDTIDSRGLAYIGYPDFNKDGDADILMDYYGNNSTFSLYLFNSLKNKFIKIEESASNQSI